jgi:hypothetical protein
VWYEQCAAVWYEQCVAVWCVPPLAAFSAGGQGPRTASWCTTPNAVRARWEGEGEERAGIEYMSEWGTRVR